MKEKELRTNNKSMLLIVNLPLKLIFYKRSSKYGKEDSHCYNREQIHKQHKELKEDNSIFSFSLISFSRMF